MSLALKAALACSSLAPMLMVIGAMRYTRPLYGQGWIGWIAAAFAMIAICAGALALLSRRRADRALDIERIERRDHETIIYFIAYLAPLFAPDLVRETATAIFTFALITFTVIQADAFHFNPFMRLIGFRCYAARIAGAPRLLISRSFLWQTQEPIPAVAIDPTVLIHVGAAETPTGR